MINNQKNNDMKETKIEIPNGKTAKWVNNVLTLVDEKPQNVMERIKTFDDALNELRDRAEHGDKEAEVLVNEYDNVNSICIKCSKDLLAYLKLRIIASALNEGWKPEFVYGERRWYPWFELVTEGEYLSKKRPKCRIVSRGGSSAVKYYGLVYMDASYTSPYSVTLSGSCITFKSKELAEYSGKQFIDIYVDYLFQSELLHITKPREIAASKK